MVKSKRNEMTHGGCWSMTNCFSCYKFYYFGQNLNVLEKNLKFL